MTKRRHSDPEIKSLYGHEGGCRPGETLWEDRLKTNHTASPEIKSLAEKSWTTGHVLDGFEDLEDLPLNTSPRLVNLISLGKINPAEFDPNQIIREVYGNEDLDSSKELR